MTSNSTKDLKPTLSKSNESEGVIMDVTLSPVRVVATTQTNVGFPFVIHIPEFFINYLDDNTKALIKKTNYSRKSPCFIKSEMNYICIKTAYGDAYTANSIWKAVSLIGKSLCFKNWID